MKITNVLLFFPLSENLIKTNWWLFNILCSNHDSDTKTPLVSWVWFIVDDYCTLTFKFRHSCNKIFFVQIITDSIKIIMQLWPYVDGDCLELPEQYLFMLPEYCCYHWWVYNIQSNDEYDVFTKRYVPSKLYFSCGQCKTRKGIQIYYLGQKCWKWSMNKQARSKILNHWHGF